MKHISLADSSEMERLLHIIYNLLLNTVTLTNYSSRRRRKKFPVCVTGELCSGDVPLRGEQCSPRSPVLPARSELEQWWPVQGRETEGELDTNQYLLYWKSVSLMCVSCKKKKDWNDTHYLLFFISHSAAANTQW